MHARLKAGCAIEPPFLRGAWYPILDGGVEGEPLLLAVNGEEFVAFLGAFDLDAAPRETAVWAFPSESDEGGMLVCGDGHHIRGEDTAAEEVYCALCEEDWEVEG